MRVRLSISDNHDVGNGPRLLEQRSQLLLVHILRHLHQKPKKHPKQEKQQITIIIDCPAQRSKKQTQASCINCHIMICLLGWPCEKKKKKKTVIVWLFVLIKRFCRHSSREQQSRPRPPEGGRTTDTRHKKNTEKTEKTKNKMCHTNNSIFRIISPPSIYYPSTHNAVYTPQQYSVVAVVYQSYTIVYICKTHMKTTTEKPTPQDSRGGEKFRADPYAGSARATRVCPVMLHKNCIGKLTSWAPTNTARPAQTPPRPPRVSGADLASTGLSAQRKDRICDLVRASCAKLQHIPSILIIFLEAPCALVAVDRAVCLPACLCICVQNSATLARSRPSASVAITPTSREKAKHSGGAARERSENHLSPFSHGIARRSGYKCNIMAEYALRWYVPVSNIYCGQLCTTLHTSSIDPSAAPT